VPMGGGLYAQLGTYPAYGVIRPTRPVTRQALFVDQEAEAVRLTGGGWAGVRRGSYIRHGIEWYLDGPADERDLHQHWLRRVAPRLTPGAPVSIYQDFPETRASVPEPSPYSTTQTPEKNGIRGVIDGQVYDISGSLAANWTRPLRRRVPMSLVVEETEALDG